MPPTTCLSAEPCQPRRQAAPESHVLARGSTPLPRGQAPGPHGPEPPRWLKASAGPGDDPRNPRQFLRHGALARPAPGSPVLLAATGWCPVAAGRAYLGLRWFDGAWRRLVRPQPTWVVVARHTAMTDEWSRS